MFQMDVLSNMHIASSYKNVGFYIYLRHFFLIRCKSLKVLINILCLDLTLYVLSMTWRMLQFLLRDHLEIIIVTIISLVLIDVQYTKRKSMAFRLFVDQYNKIT